MGNIKVRAKKILGRNIVFSDEIKGVHYDDTILKHYAETIPSEKILHWCKNNNYAIVVGPPKPMSLMEIRSIKENCFCVFPKECLGWEAYCSHDDVIQPNWLIIRKNVFSSSNEQLVPLSVKKRKANAGELCWFTIIFYEVNNMWPLGKNPTITSSTDPRKFLCSIIVIETDISNRIEAGTSCGWDNYDQFSVLSF